MITISNAKIADALEVFDMARKLSMSFDVAGKQRLSDFERVVRNEQSIFLIARIDGHVAGYLYGNTHFAFYAAQEIGWIEELYVKETYRRNGVASALVKQAECIARQRSAVLISVATRRAAPFYKKAGFEHSADYFRKLL